MQEQDTSFRGQPWDRDLTRVPRYWKRVHLQAMYHLDPVFLHVGPGTPDTQNFSDRR